jgi:hypothetical protein
LEQDVFMFLLFEKEDTTLCITTFSIMTLSI